MTAWDFIICDVFTDKALAGNQLAVFPNASHIPERYLQKLARETNFSETTFLLPPQHPEADYLVDSSKAPAQALLARATGLPVVVVHLVRDPRAVAWSHRRAKKPPAGAVARVTPQRPTAYVTSRWLARNAYIDAKVRPDIRLRYEDVVADPAAAVGAIRQVLDRIRPPSSVTTPAWEGSGSGSQHLIAGKN